MIKKQRELFLPGWSSRVVAPTCKNSRQTEGSRRTHEVRVDVESSRNEGKRATEVNTVAAAAATPQHAGHPPGKFQARRGISQKRGRSLNLYTLN